MPSLISKAGLATRMSYFTVFNFKFATGIILLAKKNATILKMIVTINTGRIKRINGTPADLMATNSKVSPNLPNAIMDDSKSANGNASGTHVTATNEVRYAKVPRSRPLPTRSSMYNQKNCRIKTNKEMRKVARNGPIKERNTSISSFLINEGYPLI